MELNNTFDFDYESIKKNESFENIKVNINGYNLIKKNDNYYQGRRFEESGFNYYFDKSNKLFPSCSKSLTILVSSSLGSPLFKINIFLGLFSFLKKSA